MIKNFILAVIALLCSCSVDPKFVKSPMRDNKLKISLKTQLGDKAKCKELRNGTEYFLSEQECMDQYLTRIRSEANRVCRKIDYRVDNCEKVMHKEVRKNDDGERYDYEYFGGYRCNVECFDPKKQRQEARKRAYTRAKNLSKACNITQKNSCEKALSLIDENDLSASFQGIPDIKRTIFSKLCNAKNPLEEYCNRWFSWEDDRKFMSVSAVNGCKVYNGQSCLNLYKILTKHNKNIEIKEIFDLTSKVLEMECLAGEENSCKNMDELSSICIRTDFDCKIFRIETKKIKKKKLQIEKQIAIEEERHRIMFELEKEKVKVQNEILNVQKRAEIRRQWKNVADQIQKSFESKNTTCRSTPAFLGGFTTTCD